jgi:hyperosmotically inducible protein
MLQKLAALVGAAMITVACAQTDAGITTNVKTKFAADDTVKAYQIDVDTANGVVTLSGAVETGAAKDHAVMIARQTDGVRDVIDQLRVDATAATSGIDVDGDVDVDSNIDDAAAREAREARERAGDAADRAGDAAERTAERAGDAAERTADRAGAIVTDAALTTSVKTKFLADDMVKGLNIDVDTDNGVVTLNGRVASQAEANRATTIARNTDGVKSVVSNLRVGS